MDISFFVERTNYKKGYLGNHENIFLIRRGLDVEGDLSLLKKLALEVWSGDDN